MSFESTISAATSFLAPVLRRPGNGITKARSPSMIEVLSLQSDTSGPPSTNDRTAVVQQACHHLLGVHQSLLELESTELASAALYPHRRIVDALLDLVSLEGIYPSLLPGVGVPIERRVKSILQGGVTSSQSQGSFSDGDLQLLYVVIDALSVISNGGGLCTALRERTLVDLIAAAAQVGYEPGRASQEYGKIFEDILNRTPASALFPALISLVHPAAPSWLKSELSARLSVLPLRPGGVRDTINFIATSDPGSRGDKSGNSETVGPALSLEVLTRASSLVSAVPSFLTADEWFAGVAAQLLVLLDEEDTDMQRAAAYIVGHGILSRRHLGAPGTSGWRYLVEPLMQTLSPREPTDPSIKKHAQQAVVSAFAMEQATKRLSALTTIHPNPGLAKRLISPLLLPLWAILCQSSQSSALFTRCFKVIQVYLTTSAGPDGFIRLADHLLWDGIYPWIFAKDSLGNVEIKTRTAEYHISSQAVSFVQLIDSRLATYTKLLDEAADGAEICTVLTRCVKTWLVQRSLRATPNRIGDDGSALTSLIYAKLIQSMLEKYNEKVAANPDQLVPLTQEILDDCINQQVESAKYRSSLATPSMSSMASIVDINEHRPHVLLKEDPAEIASVALGLLSALIISPNFNSEKIPLPTLASLRDSLTSLTSLSSMPLSLTLSAHSILSHLAHLMSLPTSSPHPLNPHESDLETHRLALSHLASPLPPVRGEGLSLFIQLITTSSPVISTASTTVLLTSTLQDPDDYVHLSSIRALALLANHNPQSVISYLVNSYVDPDEASTLDVLLRIGEAIRAAVEMLGQELPGEAARLVGHAMLAVVGRRTKRPERAAERLRATAERDRQRQEAELAWGGEVPSLDDPDDKDEYAARVITKWSENGLAEDLRVRASALSVLGVVIERSIGGLGKDIIDDAIEVALSILQIEGSEEAAILRRAAVLVIDAMSKGMEAVDQRGDTLGWSLDGSMFEYTMEVLSRVDARESDTLVKGHLQIVMDELQAWQARQLEVIIRGQDIRLTLEGRLRGLVVDPAINSLQRPSIEEVE